MTRDSTSRRRTLRQLPERAARLIDKPHYLFRPSQVMRRVGMLRSGSAGVQTVPLPWGGTITLDTTEMIGSSIARTGVTDLGAAEALWRLTDPGDLAVDVGANVGFMASLLATRVGPSGHVLAFEPHPDVFRRLVANTNAWRGRGLSIQALPIALSSTRGSALLHAPAEFGQNQGTATLSPTSEDPCAASVSTSTLDAHLGERRLGCLKVDVEGHELAVMKGAEGALSERRVRDIVFEEHSPYPSPVFHLLLEHGYEIFRILPTLARLHLRSPGKTNSGRWEAPNYLATFSPRRARRRLAAPGWRVLGRRD